MLSMSNIECACTLSQAHQLHSLLGWTQTGVQVFNAGLGQLDGLTCGCKLITASRGYVCVSLQCRQVACTVMMHRQAVYTSRVRTTCAFLYWQLIPQLRMAGIPVLNGCTLRYPLGLPSSQYSHAGSAQYIQEQRRRFLYLWGFCLAWSRSAPQKAPGLASGRPPPGGKPDSQKASQMRMAIDTAWGRPLHNS
jgi:hypothetical protein